MGSVLTPAFMGLANALDLPQASTLCGACSVVCPVKIPLPELLRSLRERQVEARLRPRLEIAAMRLWSFTARRPWLYALSSRWAARMLRILGGSSGMISILPFAGGWTSGRYLPAPGAGGTFRDRYAAGKK